MEKLESQCRFESKRESSHDAFCDIENYHSSMLRAYGNIHGENEVILNDFRVSVTTDFFSILGLKFSHGYDERNQEV
jgi:hypothetical protein